jgi:hypothetical protein
LQGIKVTDAESKKRIRQKLAEELFQKMEIESGGGWEEMSSEEAAQMKS